MLFSEFGKNVLAGWLANKLDCFISIFFDAEKTQDQNEEPQVLHNFLIERPKLFRPYSVLTDLEKILPFVERPIAHIIIEREPSTFWNLACLVIESKLTGEWYVFRRGSMAMQGEGSGARQSKICLQLLRENNVSVVTWAASQEVLNEFEGGYRLWPEVKLSLVPLFSSLNLQKDWHLILERMKEFLSPT